MKEPDEVITKVHFHIGQQFGTKVKNSVDAVKDKARIDWHQCGVKITFNGITRVCSLATVHGIDCVEASEDRERFDTSQAANTTIRRPGRPPLNKEATV